MVFTLVVWVMQMIFEASLLLICLACTSIPSILSVCFLSAQVVVPVGF